MLRLPLETRLIEKDALQKKKSINKSERQRFESRLFKGCVAKTLIMIGIPIAAGMK
jgi:hypothetical protein